jgi:prophage regulatory protein
MPQDLLSIRKVAERISFSKSWIYAEMKAGRFPKPLKLNFGKNLWSSEQIDAYIATLLKSAAK